MEFCSTQRQSKLMIFVSGLIAALGAHHDHLKQPHRSLWLKQAVDEFNDCQAEGEETVNSECSLALLQTSVHVQKRSHALSRKLELMNENENAGPAFMHSGLRVVGKEQAYLDANTKHSTPDTESIHARSLSHLARPSGQDWYAVNISSQTATSMEEKLGVFGGQTTLLTNDLPMELWTGTGMSFFQKNHSLNRAHTEHADNAQHDSDQKSATGRDEHESDDGNGKGAHVWAGIHCGMLTPRSLRSELEALQQIGNFPLREPCMSEQMWDYWFGKMSTWHSMMQETSKVPLSRLGGQHQQINRAHCIVLVWAALSTLLIINIVRGLAQSSKACPNGKSYERQSWDRGLLYWLCCIWVTEALANLKNLWHEPSSDDLGPVGDPEDEADTCFKKMHAIWQDEVTAQHIEPASVWRIMARFVGIPKLIGLGLAIMLVHGWDSVLFPLASEILLRCLQQRDYQQSMDPHYTHDLTVPCLMVFIVYTVMPCFGSLLHTSFHLVNARVEMRIEAGITMMLINKTQRLALGYRSVDKERAPDLNIMTLILVDVKTQFRGMFVSVISLQSAVPFFVLQVTLFCVRMGKAGCLGILTMALLSLCCMLVGILLQQGTLECMRYGDIRSGTLTELFTNIRSVKAFALEPLYQAFLLKIREQENTKRLQLFLVSGIAMVIGGAVPGATTVVTLSSYLKIHGGLDPVDIMMCLLIMLNLRRFMDEIISACGQAMVGGFVSIERVRSYLQLPEHAAPCGLPMNQETTNSEPLTVQIKGNFSYGNDGPDVLHDIDLCIRQGSVVAVVGGVGSGKSSLLLAILGELCASPGGHVYAPTRCSYCSQIPWIVEGTVRHNIVSCLGAKFDQQRYEAAVNGAALQPDLDRWVGGDDAGIGNQGTVLSGGQRVRISLARAAYDQANLVLVDDPYSAVDVHTAASLHEFLVAGPMLQGRTRIIGTQPNLSRLSAFDDIIVLEEGRIACHGKLADIEKHGAFQRLFGKSHDTANAQRAAGSHGSVCPHKPGVSSLDAIPLRCQESMVDPSMQTLWCALDLVGVKLFMFCWLVALVGTIIVFLASVLIATWINKKLRFQQIHPDRFYILNLALLTCVGLVILVIHTVGMAFLSLRAWRTMFANMLKSCASAPVDPFFNRNPVGRILARFTGDLTSVDLTLLGLLSGLSTHFFSMTLPCCYIHAVMPWMFTLLSIPFYTVTLWLARHYFNACCFMTNLERRTFSDTCVLVTEVESHAISIRAFAQLPHYLAKFGKTLDDNLKVGFWAHCVLRLWFNLRCSFLLLILVNMLGFAAVLAPHIIPIGTFGVSASNLIGVLLSMPHLLEGFNALQKELVCFQRAQEYSELEPEGAFELPGDCRLDVRETEILLTHICKLHLVNPNEATPLHLVDSTGRTLLEASPDGDALDLALGVGPGDISPCYQRLKGALPWHRILCVNDESGDSVTLGNALCSAKSQIRLRVQSGWLLGGVRVEVQDLVARYSTSADVLRGINLTFERSQKIGIVGPSGCGKSTLLSVFSRILEPYQGKIVLNDIDISKVGLKTLRQAVGFMPQDPFLMTGTIRSNLDPLDLATETKLWRVLENVGMSDTVQKLSGSLDYFVDTHCQSFSHGQRQLLCLARVFLRRPWLLLCDEATSAIDPQAADNITHVLLNLFHGSTVVYVAHRLSTLDSFDSIVVMKDGQVLEHGALEHLRTKVNGAFSQMLAASNE